jgi:hypothetical protein
MIGGILGMALGLALYGLGLVDGWWVVWMGIAGAGVELLARLRPGSGTGDAGWLAEMSGGFDCGGGDAGGGGGD